MKTGALIRSLLAAGLIATGVNAQAEDRIVSIGGAITEIIYALGKGDTLVARDTTSVYPEAVFALPDVGYMRSLAAEGVLSVGPTLIVADKGAGPPETIDVLQSANVEMVLVPEARSAEQIASNIRLIGDAIGAPAQADALASQSQTSLEQAHEQALSLAGENRKKVLFILSAQGGRIMAAGADTAAQAMIELAGGVNAVDAFEGYKPMTDEAITNAAPDVILMMERGGGHSISDDELFALPSIVPTPAAQNQAVLRMNGLYLLGFGPRTADAVTDLSTALYGS